MEEMKIKIPHNVLIIDATVFESRLFRAGLRGVMLDAKTGKSRQPNSTLVLGSLLHSLHLNIDYALHNSGNDAFACLLAFQKLLDPENTKAPSPRVGTARPLLTRSISLNPAPMPPIPFSPGLTPPLISAPAMMKAYSSSPHTLSPNDYFDASLNRHSSRNSPNPLFVPDTGSKRASMLPMDEHGRIKRSPSTTDLLNAKLAHATIE